jgi:hypothetical protein
VTSLGHYADVIIYSVTGRLSGRNCRSPGTSLGFAIIVYNSVELYLHYPITFHGLIPNDAHEQISLYLLSGAC